MSTAGVAMRRGRPTADDARRKLAQVIAVASEQFSALGYRAVTMRDVAEKAHVSTRTLYNRYADKLSLFVACLDFGAATFPTVNVPPQPDLERILRQHAAAIARVLSLKSSVRLGMLVYREGGEFPELVRAADDTQNRHLVQPLAAYFRETGLAAGSAEELAKLFITMALSEWQRRVTFNRPLQTDEEIDRHAALVVDVFLHGVRTVMSRLGGSRRPKASRAHDLPSRR